jgi:hypothetical protein
MIGSVDGLASRGVGDDQLTVSGGPNAGYTATRSNKESGGCQCDERQQQGVFNKILALIFTQKIHYLSRLPCLLV